MPIDRSKPGFLTTVAALVVLLVAAIIALVFMFSFMRTGRVGEVSGRAYGRFRVHYLPNHVFPDNPISPTLHYLMSFTDFIEVDSRLSANFNQEVEVHYSYISYKRFVIRHIGLSTHNVTEKKRCVF